MWTASALFLSYWKQKLTLVFFVEFQPKILFRVRMQEPQFEPHYSLFFLCGFFFFIRSRKRFNSSRRRHFHLWEEEALAALLDDVRPLTLPLFKVLQPFHVGSLPRRPTSFIDNRSSVHSENKINFRLDLSVNMAHKNHPISYLFGLARATRPLAPLIDRQGISTKMSTLNVLRVQNEAGKVSTFL